jgi:predicted transcriptional regulator
MTADPLPATGSVTVRLPTSLLRQLDELCALTERSRTYWITAALRDLIAGELADAQSVADDQPLPDDLPGDQVPEYLIAHGLTTREALERARRRSAGV